MMDYWFVEDGRCTLTKWGTFDPVLPTTTMETCSYGGPIGQVVYVEPFPGSRFPLVCHDLDDIEATQVAFSVCRYCGRTWRIGSQPDQTGKCWDGSDGCGGNLDA